MKIITIIIISLLIMNTFVFAGERFVVEYAQEGLYAIGKVNKVIIIKDTNTNARYLVIQNNWDGTFALCLFTDKENPK